ncbi:MAG TPA: multidrug efflux SMR transporter [Aggregatilineales bacterium]|nr:multidrug efflux SMR transporter [Aggregatilineales bacterium]
MSGWLMLLAAIVFEVFGTVSMKESNGLTRLIPSILIFVFYALSFILFAIALKQIEVGVAYAVWSGVGTILIVVIGYFAYKEPMTALKAVSIMLVIAGVIGLNWTAESH